MFRSAAIVAISLLIAVCSAAVAQTDVSSVQVGSESPGNDYSQIGPITAKSGGGCGLFGKKGTFQGAMTSLRKEAAEMGADYVQILQQEGEHMAGACLSRGYTIDGYAYKRTAPAGSLSEATSESQSNSQAPSAASSPSPTTTKPDLYAELLKLDDLRKRGLLTDAEFDAAKRRLLDGQ